MNDEMEMLHELFRHMEWADATVWKSVSESSAARGDSIIRGRLYHIHMVQWAFLNVWLDQPLSELPDQSKLTDIGALASWGREVHGHDRRYLDRIDQSALQRIVRPPWLDDFAKYFGKPAASVTLVQTMLQVTSHSSHHRGQVNTRLHVCGITVPYFDFIVLVVLA